MAIEFNRGNNNCIPISGIGYVVIPEDCDVAEYVQRCYRNHTLSINGGFGGTSMHKVKVAEGVLDKVKFPSGGKSQGSAVVWIRESFYNRPVVIGVIPDGGKSGFSGVGQQSLIQEVLQRAAEVFIDGANSRVNITARGDDNVVGEVNIKASSQVGEDDAVNIDSNDFIRLRGKRLRVNLTDDAEVVINNGNNNENEELDKDILKIKVDKEKTTITDQWKNSLVIDQEKINLIDHFGNNILINGDEVHLVDAHNNEAIFNEEHTQFLTQKFDVGEGKEQMVLGNTLVQILGELIDAILSLTVLTPQGASGTPINAATFSGIKSKLESILSKLSNTD